MPTGARGRHLRGIASRAPPSLLGARRAPSAAPPRLPAPAHAVEGLQLVGHARRRALGGERAGIHAALRRQLGLRQHRQRAAAPAQPCRRSPWRQGLFQYSGAPSLLVPAMKPFVFLLNTLQTLQMQACGFQHLHNHPQTAPHVPCCLHVLIFNQLVFLHSAAPP